MDSFGVVSTKLKAISKSVVLPSVYSLKGLKKEEVIDFEGAKVKNLTTLGEQSATGMNAIRGVLVVEVKAGSVASRFLQVNDVILKYNAREVNNLNDLGDAQIAVKNTSTDMVIFRNQKEVKIKVKYDNMR
jgi:S1-C subfamily serine protease